MKKSSHTLTTKEDVLEFWLGDAGSSAELARKRKQLWYRSGPELDQLITERFSDLLQAASHRELDSWRASAQGCLALVILLDQFSRHIYRGQHKAFAQDELALEVTLDFAEHRELSFLERAFFYHPLEHSESAQNQMLSVQRFEQLSQDASSEWRPMMADFFKHACEHRDIIEKFGRFPHRNAILGRASSPAEKQFLEDGGATFGQTINIDNKK